MPITYVIESDQVSTTLSGEFSVSEVVAYRAKLFADPQYRGGMASLIDCRAVTTLPTTAQLRQVAGHIGTQGAVVQRARCAVVLGTDAAFGLVRMYAVYTESEASPVQLAPFRDLASAQAWLKQ